MKIGGASEEFRGILDKIDIEVRESCGEINMSLLLWCKLRNVWEHIAPYFSSRCSCVVTVCIKVSGVPKIFLGEMSFYF